MLTGSTSEIPENRRLAPLPVSSSGSLSLLGKVKKRKAGGGYGRCMQIAWSPKQLLHPSMFVCAKELKRGGKGALWCSMRIP